MILVSACLLGHRVKYDGGTNTHDLILRYHERGQFLAICPECFALLPVPRPPMELCHVTGAALLAGKGKAVDRNGLDTTEYLLTGAQKVLKEFALDEGETVEVGQAVTVANFEGVKYVDVTGMTKGKGFAGVLKKWGFAGGNMTHGGHSKRRTGGLAARDLPGWIEKGKKMPGDMGDVSRKAMNLEVVAIRPEDNALLVKGSIPGARNGIVFVRKSLKNNVVAAKAAKGGK